MTQSFKSPVPLTLEHGCLPVVVIDQDVLLPHSEVFITISNHTVVSKINKLVENNKLVALYFDHAPIRQQIVPNNSIACLAEVVTVSQPLHDNGNMTYFVKCLCRIELTNVVTQEELNYASSVRFKYDDDLTLVEHDAYIREVSLGLRSLQQFVPKITSDFIQRINLSDNPELVCDVVVSFLAESASERFAFKMEFLQIKSLKRRFQFVLEKLNYEIMVHQASNRIKSRVVDNFNRNTQLALLQAQKNEIMKELGEDNGDNELAELEHQIKCKNLPPEISHKALTEFKRLKTLPPSSSEGGVIRNYINHLLALPWHEESKLNYDMALASTRLDADHAGLSQVKELIIEYLAVIKRNPNSKAPILCLVGPPGIGKTSLGSSIAKATGRNYTRIALGGLSYESEIRGHSRAYVGAMPGKIMRNMISSKVNNPLILLDEIDKVSDARGDVSSALLEVLDPEQNKAFVDNYTDEKFDLSKVLFICTANSLNIQPALKDRMELVFLSSYTENEKIEIALSHIVPRAIKNVGLQPTDILINRETLKHLIRGYTNEAGVRSLDRLIARICRKVLVKLETGKHQGSFKVSKIHLQQFFGPAQNELACPEPRRGLAIGLAWTEVSGCVLPIEATVMTGKGRITLSGNLGNVMKESAHAAITYLRSQAKSLGITHDFDNIDIHLHAADGATPKDGPSAGIAITTAIYSALTGKVAKSIAMTGEISLHGNILPIGGIKEKLLAAYRAKITQVLLPQANHQDLETVPKEVIKALQINWVTQIDQIFAYLFD